jgi:hypothetical protein
VILVRSDRYGLIESRNVFPPLPYHQGDAGAVAEVGAGFVAAACEVEVGDGGGVEDAEAIDAFGGEVDAAVGGGGEEEMLGLDEGLEFGGEVGIEFGHDFWDGGRDR